MNLISFEINNRPALEAGRKLAAQFSFNFTIECNGEVTPNQLRITYRILSTGTHEHVTFDNQKKKLERMKTLHAFSGSLTDTVSLQTDKAVNQAFQVKMEVSANIVGHSPVSPELIFLNIVP